jgi:transposase-like protein
MQRFTSIIDLIHMDGPTLQDYVTPDELDQLIDGTLPHAVIADRYISDYGTQVTESAQDSFADLLAWIPMEIECAVQQRKEIASEEAAAGKLRELKAHAEAEDRHERISRAYKLTLIEQARESGIHKSEIAEALGISRPTLDKWIQEQADRSLFNDAIYTLVRRDMSKEDQGMLFQALGIRDTSAQASVFLAGLSTRTLDDLCEGEGELIARAEKRARELA